MRAKGNRWTCLSIILYYGLVCMDMRGNLETAAKYDAMVPFCMHDYFTTCH